MGEDYRMTAFPTRLSVVVTGVVVSFAAWGLLATIGIALRAGLQTIAWGVFPAVTTGVAASLWEWRRVAPPVRPEPAWTAPTPMARAATLAAAAGMAALPFTDHALAAAWWVAVGLMAAILYLRENNASALPAADETCRWDTALLGLAAVIAIAVTILSNRPQWEDFHYLFMVEHARHNPARPIYDLFTSYAGRGEVYAWHPREVLVAGLSRLTGISVLVWYYYVLPILHAVMTVTVIYLSARYFAARDAAWVTVVCVVSLVAWGEVHQTFGNFSFARMFHGQAVVASWAAPAAFLFGLRFGRERSLASFMLAAAAVLCAYAQWHTGAVVAPLAVLVGALAAWPSRGKVDAPLLAMGLAALLFGAFVAAAHQFPAYWNLQRFVPAADGLTKVFPPDFRSMVALAMVVLTGVMLPGTASRLATRAAFFGLILVLDPYGMQLLSSAISSLSFRVLWGFPFALFLGLGVVAAARLEMLRWRVPVVTGTVLVAFLASGQWITAATNRNAFGDAGFKIFPELLQWQQRDEDRLPSTVGMEPGLQQWFRGFSNRMTKLEPALAPVP